jgi:hypothetical protein
MNWAYHQGRGVSAVLTPKNINGQKRHYLPDPTIGGVHSMGFLVLGGAAILFIVWFG